MRASYERLSEATVEVKRMSSASDKQADLLTS